MNVQNLGAAAVFGGISVVCLVGAVTLNPVLIIPAAACGLIALAILFPGNHHSSRPLEYPSRSPSPETVVHHTYYPTVPEARAAAAAARADAEANRLLQIREEQIRREHQILMAQQEAELARARAAREAQARAAQVRAAREAQELAAQQAQARAAREAQAREAQVIAAREAQARAAAVQPGHGFGGGSAFVSPSPVAHPQAVRRDDTSQSHGFGGRSAFGRNG